MGNDRGVYVGVVLACKLPTVETKHTKLQCENCQGASSLYNIKPTEKRFCPRCGGEMTLVSYAKKEQLDLYEFFDDDGDLFYRLLLHPDSKDDTGYFTPNTPGNYIKRKYSKHSAPEITDLSPEIVTSSIANFKGEFKAQLVKLAVAEIDCKVKFMIIPWYEY